MKNTNLEEYIMWLHDAKQYTTVTLADPNQVKVDPDGSVHVLNGFFWFKVEGMKLIKKSEHEKFHAEINQMINA